MPICGKSAIVFKSTDGTKPSILKVFDRELVERFGEEAQAERVRRELTLVGKTHPNLVKIYGVLAAINSATQCKVMPPPGATLWFFLTFGEE
jgi:hypothetical protein